MFELVVWYTNIHADEYFCKNAEHLSELGVASFSFSIL